jgi:hypothetical protein
MLKAALRASLQFHKQPVALLESADRVLSAVKQADMYATLAMLYFDGLDPSRVRGSRASAYSALSLSQR